MMCLWVTGFFTQVREICTAHTQIHWAHMVCLGTHSNCFAREVTGWSRRTGKAVWSYSAVWQIMLHCLMGSQVPVKMTVHASVLWSHALRWYYLGKKKRPHRGRVSAEREEQEVSFPLFLLCMKLPWHRMSHSCREIFTHLAVFAVARF